MRCLWRPVARCWWMVRWNRLNNLACALFFFFLSVFHTAVHFQATNLGAQCSTRELLHLHPWMMDFWPDGETDREGPVKQLQDSRRFHHNVSGQQQNRRRAVPQHTAWVSYRCSGADSRWAVEPEGVGCAERERKQGERGSTRRKEVENQHNSSKKRGSCLQQHH